MQIRKTLNYNQLVQAALNATRQFDPTEQIKNIYLF